MAVGLGRVPRRAARLRLRLAARTLLSPCPHPTARDSRHSSLTLLPAVAGAEKDDLRLRPRFGRVLIA